MPQQSQHCRAEEDVRNNNTGDSANSQRFRELMQTCAEEVVEFRDAMALDPSDTTNAANNGD